MVLALAASALSYGLMQSFVNPLLPSMRVYFRVDEASVAWFVTGFLLTASVSTPIAGRLGDMFGRVRVLRIVLTVFTVGTVLSALADTYVVMLVARMLQGVGGSLFPLAYGLLRERLDDRATVGGIGLISSLIAVGSGTAIITAGPVVALWGLRSVFAIAAVVVLVSTVLVWMLVAPDIAPKAPGRVDVVGALVMAAWLSALLIGITQTSRWGLAAPATIALLIGGVVLMGLWCLIEYRAPIPIVNVRLMATAAVAWANLLGFAFGFLFFTGMVVIPAFVQSPVEGGFGFSATIAETALYLLPQTIMFFVTSVLARAIHRWPGSRNALVVGAAFAIVGTTGLLLWHDAPLQVIFASGMTGTGIGIIYSQLASVLVLVVPAGEVGSASGMNTNVRNIGGALGALLCGVLLAGFGERGFELVFAAMATAATLALVPAFALASSRRR